MQVTLTHNGTLHPHLKYYYFAGSPIETIENPCLSYFTSGKIYLYLGSTNLRCDACLLWLSTCSDRVRALSAKCSSPKGLENMDFEDAVPFLADIPCNLHTGGLLAMPIFSFMACCFDSALFAAF